MTQTAAIAAIAALIEEHDGGDARAEYNLRAIAATMTARGIKLDTEEFWQIVGTHEKPGSEADQWEKARKVAWGLT